MTELQTSLIAIGGTVIVGVFAYNKWQEYRAKKNVERAFSSDPEDVLMKTEPQLAQNESGSQEDGSAVLPQGEVTADPLVEHAQEADESASAPAMPAAPQKIPLVDELIDFLIPIMLEGPLWGEKILPVIQGLRHVGSKPIHYIGQLENGSWETISHGFVYTNLCAGVQLANRNSALNEIEYSELVMNLRQLADNLNAEIDVPDMQEVITAARELHHFVSEHDAQLSINVQAKNAPWAISTLRSALVRQGFDLRPDGRLIMSDGDSILFSLVTNAAATEETTSRLTLLLDVPRVAPSRDGFGAMAACAKSLAARLDGAIVDDTNQPLSSDSLAEIAAQVQDFYRQMDAVDIPAGSARALRLFS
ncbi:cell division protein ZipA C-terminal FtsZ-binding domain-containing protein [Oxalobacteraceae bacterium R-40]|uniref:Cell division protein ZipA n=1 Tax=Keguizhuia sedimenti TaxID=3064264 RepID=A0ABU1BRF9_9BURK|nr:cell division protein ZipA C-terminal FtsZ-binding domain-containing protein [Oxalobacteraceae bacterium R-40]